MSVNLSWAGRGTVNTWAIKMRSREGDLKVTTTNRIDFAEAASDAYLQKNNLNGGNHKGWKIEAISLVENISEVEK